MKRHSQYHQMLDRGRKAGLSARELYTALAVRPVEGVEHPGQADCNGVISHVSADGHRTFQAGQPSREG